MSVRFQEYEGGKPRHGVRYVEAERGPKVERMAHHLEREGVRLTVELMGGGKGDVLFAAWLDEVCFATAVAPNDETRVLDCCDLLIEEAHRKVIDGETEDWRLAGQEERARREFNETGWIDPE